MDLAPWSPRSFVNEIMQASQKLHTQMTGLVRNSFMASISLRQIQDSGHISFPLLNNDKRYREQHSITVANVF